MFGCINNYIGSKAVFLSQLDISLLLGKKSVEGEIFDYARNQTSGIILGRVGNQPSPVLQKMDGKIFLSDLGLIQLSELGIVEGPRLPNKGDKIIVVNASVVKNLRLGNGVEKVILSTYDELSRIFS